MSDLHIAQNATSQYSQRICLSFAAKTQLKAMRKILNTLLRLEITGQKRLVEGTQWMAEEIKLGKHLVYSEKLRLMGNK